MDAIEVIGGIALKGRIPISGAKNAALPLMAACLLSEETLTLSNVPNLGDITTMANLLVQHGVEFTLDGSGENIGEHHGRVIQLKAAHIHNLEAPYDIVRKMRASVLVLGPLLTRFGQVKVSLPGGCAIGTRPIDMHLKALEQMGATIVLEEGYVHAFVKGRLQGAEIFFDKVSVGATENIVMAATLAKGRTVIHSAAREPEVTDLVECLLKMGANIKGVGTDKLIIEGVEALHSASHDVIADRIECGTYMTAAVITGGEIELIHARMESMEATVEKLTEAGATITQEGDVVRVKGSKTLKPLEITTQPYPGFATDMQAQLMALLCLAEGTSIVHETIFENRFMHVSELCRMGASISVEGHTAVIKGVKKLKGAPVMATDLRASVSLVLAALAAEGKSRINRIYHLDRGYERLEEKLAACGARIERVKA